MSNARKRKRMRTCGNVPQFVQVDSLERRQLLTGNLDVSFGDGTGYVQMDLDDTEDVGRKLVLQNDGKIIVGGKTDFGGGGSNFVVARYLSNGQIDPAFGGHGGSPDGTAVTDFGGGDDLFYSVIVQPDEKILAMGSVWDSSLGESVGLVRYNPDGSLDASFGIAGKLSLVGRPEDLLGDGEMFYAHDKIVLEIDGQMIRLNPSDGSFDATFGGGIVSFDNYGILSPEIFVADDFIYVSGHQMIEGAYNPMISRFHWANGTLDVGFGSQGIVDLPNQLSSVNEYFVASDGKIVGVDSNNNLFRLEADGTLDNGSAAFHVDGIAEIKETIYAQHVLPQPGGPIIVVGRNVSGKLAVLRWGSDGVRDRSFGNGGYAEYDLQNAHDINPNDVVGYANGNILIAGTVLDDPAGTFDLMLTRIDVSAESNIDPPVDELTFEGADDHGAPLRTTGESEILIDSRSSGSVLPSDNQFVRTGHNARSSENSDPSFGYGLGFVQTDLDNTYDQQMDMTVQSDGRILAAGMTNFGGGDDNFLIIRYLTDGRIDTSFGGFGGAPDGMVVTDFNGGEDKINSVEVLANGKILVMGAINNQSAIGFARYNSDGSMDTTFGEDGWVVWDTGSEEPVSTGGMVFHQGKILFSCDGLLIRLNQDGSPDGTFNGGSIDPKAWGINNGRFEVSGDWIYYYSSWTGQHLDKVVARMNWSNGTLDNGFGINGITDLQSNVGNLRDIFVDSSGRFVALSYSNEILRFTPNGSADNGPDAFGVDGIINVSVPGELDYLLQQPGGVIAAIGNADNGGLCVVRIGSDGDRDSGFGDNGYAEYSLADAVDVYPSSVIGFANDNILVGGSMRDVAVSSLDFMLTRIVVDYQTTFESPIDGLQNPNHGNDPTHGIQWETTETLLNEGIYGTAEVEQFANATQGENGTSQYPQVPLGWRKVTLPSGDPESLELGILDEAFTIPDSDSQVGSIERDLMRLLT